MAKFWEKGKKMFGRRSESSKQGTEAVTKTVSGEGPGVTNTVDEKTKQTISSTNEKAPKTVETIEGKTKERASALGKKVSEAVKTVVDKTKKIASLVGEKAPEVAESVADKTKSLASVVTEKTEYAVTYSKLKIRLHNLNSNVEKTMSEIGGRTYELFQQNQKNVYQDEDIEASIEKVKTLNKEIKATEKEIEKLSVDE